MKTSLEFACETFFISLFRADSRLKGKTIVHSDEEQLAKSNAIVIEAKEGNHSLAGFGGYELELTVEYRATANSTKARNDLIAAALHSIVYNSTLNVRARARMASDAGLSDLIIKDECTSDRQNSADLRKRFITFPLQAKLT